MERALIAISQAAEGQSKQSTESHGKAAFTAKEYQKQYAIVNRAAKRLDQIFGGGLPFGHLRQEE
ncbi:hypothetical protein J1614_006146 [Plenodomus biglobosus]|nr:hypothetical protein J1614_006146 [Plenodomus biglobosus]